MQLKPLKIKDLTAEIPIIQGGMGIGVGMSRLAGAVAKEGGIGLLSAAQPGYNMEHPQGDFLEITLEALGQHIQKAKDLSEGKGIVGVNIMRAARDYERYVNCCVENQVDLIISGAGLPLELPVLLKDSNTKFAPIVSSLKAAKVLFQMWDRRYGKVADMVVIEGPMAGGHLGFSQEQLLFHKHNPQAYLEEVKEIVAYVNSFKEKYGEIPVIFAGGVYDKSDIETYISLGCSGVQMATRFVATHECDASDAFKNAYVSAKKEDIQLMMSPVGLPGRALGNRFLQQLNLHQKFPIKKCVNCLSKCDVSKVPFCISNSLINAVEGDVEDSLVFVGENVHRVEKIVSVADLMKELVY